MDYKALNTMIIRYRKYHHEDVLAPVLAKEVLELYKSLKYDDYFYTMYIESMGRKYPIQSHFLDESRAVKESMQSISQLISTVDDDLDRNILHDRYIKGMTLEQLADKYYYCLHTITRKCDRYLKTDLTEVMV